MSKYGAINARVQFFFIPSGTENWGGMCVFELGMEDIDGWQ